MEDRREKRKIDRAPRTEPEKAWIEIKQFKHKLYLAEMERDLWQAEKDVKPTGFTSFFYHWVRSLEGAGRSSTLRFATSTL